MPRQATTKLTPELQEKILLHLRVGAYVETAAACARIHKDTFYEWMKKGARGMAPYPGDLGMVTDDFPQFHYYPQKLQGIKNWFVPHKLPPFSETQAFIGEFQSGLLQGDQAGTAPWPELSDTIQQGAFSRTVARLQLIEAKGYGLAVLWPDQAGNYDPKTAATEPLPFSQPILDGIRQYLNH
jgi:hypothetical protein